MAGVRGVTPNRRLRLQPLDDVSCTHHSRSSSLTRVRGSQSGGGGGGGGGGGQDDEHGVAGAGAGGGAAHDLRRPSRPQVADALGARALWARGVTGAGIRVAVFDTGYVAWHVFV